MTTPNNSELEKKLRSIVAYPLIQREVNSLLALIHTENQRAVEEAKKSAVEHYEQFAVYMIPEGGDMSINAVPLSVIKLNLATINQSKVKK